MNYTMITMQEVHGTQEINLDANGNKYNVGLYDTKTKLYSHKTFDTIEAAEAAFLKLASCFIRGEYDYSGREEILQAVTA